MTKIWKINSDYLLSVDTRALRYENMEIVERAKFTHKLCKRWKLPTEILITIFRVFGMGTGTGYMRIPNTHVNRIISLSFCFHLGLESLVWITIQFFLKIKFIIIIGNYSCTHYTLQSPQAGLFSPPTQIPIFTILNPKSFWTTERNCSGQKNSARHLRGYVSLI